MSNYRERRLVTVLRSLMDLISTGELVRNVSRDSDPDYLRRQMALVGTLKEAQDCIEESE